MNAPTPKRMIWQTAIPSAGFLMVLTAFLFCLSVQSQETFPNRSDESQPSFVPTKLESQLLPNLLQVQQRIYSGGLPKGRAAFEELVSRGIKTVISVDGATPDIETAKSLGLRYVHLPHGYDGVPHTCEIQLAKALQELSGPFYIHCHHGKHRSPAATAAACIVAGQFDNEQGLKILQLAGTGKNYIGLFDSVRQARPAQKELLRTTPSEFPEIATRTPVVETMVRIEELLDKLKSQETEGWTNEERDSRDTPAHLALLLWEEFREMGRATNQDETPAQYHQFTSEAILLSKALEDSLRANKNPSDALKKIERNCKSCHEQFRDRPETKVSK